LPNLSKHIDTSTSQLKNDEKPKNKRDYLHEVNNLSPDQGIDLQEIKSYKIDNIALKEDGSIIEFQCPITSTWYKLSNNPYHLVLADNTYYIFLSNQNYLKITNQEQTKPSSPSPSSSPFKKI